MVKHRTPSGIAPAIWCALFLFANTAMADNYTFEKLLELPVEDLINVQIGSRTGNNLLGKHKIPVDIITADELRRSGYAELPKVLNVLVPGFTYNFSTIDDLTDDIRPFSFNGLKASHVLVLLNGKRIHSSAIFDESDSQNRGGPSVDLNLIPIEIIDHIEILRDDASAQYGSDAIAGVINIVMKQAVVDEVVVSAGQRSAGDGAMYSATYNHGTAHDFVSLTYTDKAWSNTAGLDRRDYYFAGDSRNGDYRTTHRYGDPQAHTLSFAFNGDTLFSNPDLYYQGKLAYKESESPGFFRLPSDDRTVRAIYPNGFLPLLAPEQLDLLGTLGFKSELGGYKYDLSNTVGYNHVDIGVKDSLNTSMGLDSPTSFDAGGIGFLQNSLDLDFTGPQDDSDHINIAFGGEYRHENYRISAGETASWVNGGVTVLDGPNTGVSSATGSQLYQGFSPDNASQLSRDVFALYVEAAKALTETLDLSIALRDEHYSDFGNTLNGKAWINYAVTASLDFRASLSSGFRAPSLHQMGYYRTGTYYSTGVGQYFDSGVFPVDHPLSRLLGAQDLEPEKSLHTNVGFSWQARENLSFSLDYFIIELDDRIFLSGSIPNSASLPQAAQDYMASHQIDGANYFMNAVDTTTRGLDASVQYDTQIDQHPLTLELQYHYNKTEIDRIHVAEEITSQVGDIFQRGEQERLVHYLPEQKAILSARYQMNNWTLYGRGNYFGKVLYVDDSDDASRDQWFSANVTFDLDIAYKLTPQTVIALGGHNIFNTYPDYRFSDQPFYGEGNIFQYRGISPFDYTGAFYYLRGVVEF